MNQSHLTYLASPAWAKTLREDLHPWIRATADLGDDVLEIGPGPGLTTELVLEIADRVTAVEIDPELAEALRARLQGGRAEILFGDATTLDLPSGRYSAALCFSMLHHMESSEAQDRLFARLHRVLRPGGVLLGVDSFDTEPIRRGHIGDIFVPVDPNGLGRRLEAAGSVDVAVTTANEHQFRFHAIRPPAARPEQSIAPAQA